MPVIRPKFQTFTREHEGVIRNEYWYDDGPPMVGMSFTAARTKQRWHPLPRRKTRDEGRQ